MSETVLITRIGPGNVEGKFLPLERTTLQVLTDFPHIYNSESARKWKRMSLSDYFSLLNLAGLQIVEEKPVERPDKGYEGEIQQTVQGSEGQRGSIFILKFE